MEEIECEPVDRVVVDSENWPPARAPEPSTVAPSFTVTVPVGDPDPAALASTVVVNATLSP